MAKDKTLTPIEKNQVKQFVSNLVFNIQILQNCDTRKELKTAMQDISDSLDTTPIDKLMQQLENEEYD